MVAYLQRVKLELELFKSYKVQQIPREHNSVADALARLASSMKDESADLIPVRILQRSSISPPYGTMEIVYRYSWMDQIKAYLKDGEVPEDNSEARTLRAKSARYVLINDQLYKRGYDTPLLKCVDREDADYILREIHEGICGNHSSGRALAYKVLHQGYYWLTVYEDEADFVRKCDRCQRFADIPRAPP